MYIYIYISVCLCLYIIYTISYTLIAVNISFFHRLISFKVQSCNNLNGTNREEGRAQQEKKTLTDRKLFETIACE